MQAHNIEWRSVPLKVWNDWLVKGFDEELPFPFEDWIIAVDGVPIAEVNGETRLIILPQVYDFLFSRRSTWIEYSTQRTNGDGNNSSASMEDITESSIET